MSSCMYVFGVEIYYLVPLHLPRIVRSGLESKEYASIIHLVCAQDDWKLWNIWGFWNNCDGCKGLNVIRVIL